MVQTKPFYKKKSFIFGGLFLGALLWVSFLTFSPKDTPEEIPQETPQLTQSVRDILLNGQIPYDYLFQTNTSSKRIAVYIPFPEKYLPIMLVGFFRWSILPPCTNTTMHFAKHFDLFLHFSRGDGEKASKLLRYALEKRGLDKCFANIIFHNEDIPVEKDQYLCSDGLCGMPLMFAQLWARGDLAKNYSHLVFIEPDVFPVQPHWLMLFYKQIRLAPESFWMKGTRTSQPELECIMNANAIFALGNPIFDAFVNRAFELYPAAGVDMAITYWKAHSVLDLVANWNKFIYSHWIRDESSYFLNLAAFPETFFVHVSGGQYKGVCSVDDIYLCDDDPTRHVRLQDIRRNFILF